MNVNYMLISFVLLILAAIPFVRSFEKRKPRAREVVLVAIMSAISAIANVICAYTVPLHAGTALVIVTGAAFGPETGFLVGALARFTCNFFMGQGMWTPWQMLAWGILGGLAGIAFAKPVIIGIFEDKKEIRRKQAKVGIRAIAVPTACIIFSELLGYIIFILTGKAGDTFFGWWLYGFGILGIIISCVSTRVKLPVNFITLTGFTFITVFVIYGGLMNLAAAMMQSATAVEIATVMDSGTITGTGLSLNMLKVLYISGAPYDALHALGASACMFVFGDSMLQKLERVKIKYGLYFVSK